MEKAKEVLSKYFDKIEVELKNEKKDSFIADLSQLRSNIFKLLNEYTSTKADEWKKMELLLEKLSKDFADETWSKDFNTIYVSFSLFRGNRVFEKRLLLQQNRRKKTREFLRSQVIFIQKALQLSADPLFCGLPATHTPATPPQRHQSTTARHAGRGRGRQTRSHGRRRGRCRQAS